MNTSKVIQYLSQGFILLSALSLLSVSLMALVNPQSVMDLIQVKLMNNDAFSSIRGVYGGVGFVLFMSLIYLMFNDMKMGLVFLSLLWGFYAFSRIITIFCEGTLGAFGQQWLLIESFLFISALGLVMASNRHSTFKTVSR